MMIALPRHGAGFCNFNFSKAQRLRIRRFRPRTRVLKRGPNGSAPGSIAGQETTSGCIWIAPGSRGLLQTVGPDPGGATTLNG
jgi:hypothetical protein